MNLIFKHNLYKYLIPKNSSDILLLISSLYISSLLSEEFNGSTNYSNRTCLSCKKLVLLVHVNTYYSYINCTCVYYSIHLLCKYFMMVNNAGFTSSSTSPTPLADNISKMSILKTFSKLILRAVSSDPSWSSSNSLSH